MLRFLLVVLLSATFVPLPVHADSVDWVKVVSRMEKSIVALTYQTEPDGPRHVGCTGIVINAETVLTANHCGHPSVLVDGKPFELLYQDERLDTAILRVRGMRKAHVRAAFTTPKRGTEVGALGFPMRLETPVFKQLYISNPSASVISMPGRYVILDQQLAPGMSGGPVFDKNGLLVTVTQRASSTIDLSMGRPIQDIFNATKQFWYGYEKHVSN